MPLAPLLSLQGEAPPVADLTRPAVSETAGRRAEGAGRRRERSVRFPAGGKRFTVPRPCGLFIIYGCRPRAVS